MNKQLITLGTTILFGWISICGVKAQDMSNAGTYMNHFNELYKPIQKNMWDYTSSVAKGKKAKKIDKKRQELLLSLSQGERSAARAKDWEGDEALRDQVVEWLKTSQIILKEEYGKIMDLEEIAEQSYDNMEAYLLAKEKASEHMQQSNTALNMETKRFAVDNNVNLIEEDTKIGKKLERANKVFKYYNEIYLIFFKAYKQEAYLIEAMTAQDVNAIEQNKNSLLDFAEEGRTKLRATKTLNNDPSMKLAADKMMQFYIQEAKVDAQTILDFYMKKEHFEKVKASFEAKKKSSRTKADVDEYNKAINDYNSAINEYNSKNNELNNKRSQNLDNWNKAVDKYLSKHAA